VASFILWALIQGAHLDTAAVAAGILPAYKPGVPPGGPCGRKSYGAGNPRNRTKSGG